MATTQEETMSIQEKTVVVSRYPDKYAFTCFSESVYTTVRVLVQLVVWPGYFVTEDVDLSRYEPAGELPYTLHVARENYLTDAKAEQVVSALRAIGIDCEKV